MEQVVTSIFICVVLPVAIVLIVNLTSINNDNKRAEILLKAIESGQNVDIDRLADSLGASRSRRRRNRTPLEILNRRLLKGCIFTLTGLASMVISLFDLSALDNFNIIPSGLGALLFAIGVSYLIVYFVTRKQIPQEEKEIKEEESNK
ncbi:MAG: hypothetical protein HDR48_00365 [Bacteroides sp.]|nr:hypothetical protein [Bacteroides sp.]MBD5418473.1 hypothetical protein [Bacteroides sp.]MBD5418481.1 hypothetical protein [Bacteroides sp.]